MRPIKVRAGRYRFRGYVITRRGRYWRIVGEPRTEYGMLRQALAAITARGEIYWFAAIVD
jgi:hypothetical protein